MVDGDSGGFGFGGLFEGGDVPYVSGVCLSAASPTDRIPSSSSSRRRKLWSVFVDEPSLVGIGGLVWRARDHGSVDGFVHEVHDCEGVFVVSEADLPAGVCDVGASVNDALSVMDVSILGRAAGVLGVGWIGDVDHEDVVAGTGPDGVDVLAGSGGKGVTKAGKMCGHILVGVEDPRISTRT